MSCCQSYCLRLWQVIWEAWHSLEVTQWYRPRLKSPRHLRKETQTNYTTTTEGCLCSSEREANPSLGWLTLQKNAKNAVLDYFKTKYLNVGWVFFHYIHFYFVPTVLSDNRILSIFLRNVQKCYFTVKNGVIYFKVKREQPLPVQRGENKMLNFRKDKLCKLVYWGKNKDAIQIG